MRTHLNSFLEDGPANRERLRTYSSAMGIKAVAGR